MLVTITEYDSLATDVHGNLLPIGGRRLASQGLTEAGNGIAYNGDTRFVRIATDTSVQFRPSAAGADTDDDLVLANTVEFFKVEPGATPSIAALA
ncbi:hypothetical protein [Sphingosinicella rhizophila]|uniref:Uncharacterized protein n=1 Tax=Sphingosinicella rhizophila TaxID=3050082 RepID=A0ABU3Q553_9SPHN|nr:hypothetical protein [Sphingosinicella sp. GR2756]MDT9598529.1 hypothetical protein [Sphingosinicella sp. GR2756]